MSLLSLSHFVGTAGLSFGGSMIVSIPAFDNYSGNFEDSEAAVQLKTDILRASQELVGE